jgi:Putative prokaryotic signal transducing protein
MKRIYQAANNIEAHMVMHVLQQAGVHAMVQGEFLQSGAGELPLGGLVAVAVADEDVQIARAIIGDWEKLMQEPAGEDDPAGEEESTGEEAPTGEE